jgi:hypothetical protein
VVWGSNLKKRKGGKEEKEGGKEEKGKEKKNTYSWQFFFRWYGPIMKKREGGREEEEGKGKEKKGRKKRKRCASCHIAKFSSAANTLQTG